MKFPKRVTFLKILTHLDLGHLKLSLSLLIYPSPSSSHLEALFSELISSRSSLFSIASRARPKPSHPFLSEEAKKPDIEKCLEVVATLEARTVLVRRLNLTYVMFSLCEYVKLSKQTTVQAREVVSSLVETIQGACRLGGCFKAMVLMGI
ncbi:unnamed protein product [Brassica napus]|uniref:(rape) hypothetical protein n=2 Tax=Brassica TaxID=3705 RepID=A0A816R2V7_BRANA|nr:unnamed protein product [Brassica napus]